VLGLSREHILGSNLFAYCKINPVNNSDPTGYWITRAITAAVGAAIFGGVAYAICRLFGVNKKATAIVTAVFATLGLVLGAIFVPSILRKIVTKIIKVIDNLRGKIKITKPNSKGKILGVTFSGIIGVFLRYTYPYSSKKVKTYTICVSVEAKLNGRWLAFLAFDIVDLALVMVRKQRKK
jgi:hypothetical protein